jgi:hypothetical protein
MKIGKAEIGVIGIIGLVLSLPSAFLTFYGLLTDIYLTLIGASILILATALYFGDLFAHRKKRLNA